MVSGTRIVRFLHPARSECFRLIKPSRDRKIMRRHALKLRYWPDMHPKADSGEVLDLDWSWVRACQGLNIGELRIHEKIDGFDNWRVIFFEGPKPKVADEMPRLWVIQLLKKKRNEFTDANIETFKLRRLMVVQRYYEAKN